MAAGILTHPRPTGNDEDHSAHEALAQALHKAADAQAEVLHRCADLVRLAGIQAAPSTERDELLTTGQACKVLNVSPNTLRKYGGRCRRYVGSKVRWDRRALIDEVRRGRFKVVRP